MPDLDKLRNTILISTFLISISITLGALGIANAVRSLGHG